ncbi:hypothetical protein HPB51_017675 [Rhipicephalus microplus]|uniref:RNase H type-1 domain-containing protein n=1 Tax=Rhipicephalus microplus TaxID=6941 RepID=A0A9J6E337_RHIMP|nr:hypothetical protein HPB51_017675 [Rhipicephalus microplus]
MLYPVPGHSGLFENELADFLAARAAQLGDARQAPLTPRAVCSMLKKEQLGRWESDWTQGNADMDLFKWVPYVSNTSQWFPPNQALETLLTGHGASTHILIALTYLQNPSVRAALHAREQITISSIVRSRPRLRVRLNREPIMSSDNTHLYWDTQETVHFSLD